jgi:hypothetical protein
LEEEDEDATVNGVVGQGNAHGDDVRSLEVMMNVWMDDTKSICAGRLWGGARRLQTPPLRQKGVDYGTRMETNVFVFTLFFLFPSLFSWYDIVQVPTNLGSRYSAFFLRERIFCEILQV